MVTKVPPWACKQDEGWQWLHLTSVPDISRVAAPLLCLAPSTSLSPAEIEMGSVVVVRVCSQLSREKRALEAKMKYKSLERPRGFGL